MNSITMKLQADELIRLALQEDITSEDVSTNAVMPHAVKGTVDLIAKEDGVVAGLDVYARVFQILDELTEINFHCKDGDEVKKGDLMATVTGDIRVLLSGERVALNYLQRMCGIATYTRQVARLLEGRVAVIADGTPVVITVPYLFSENFQSDEDYYIGFLSGSISRLLRIASFIVAAFAPALFIALCTFHGGLLPTSLALSVMRLRTGVPASSLSECIMLILCFEVLKEASARAMQEWGVALSIVGGLVIGQAAVDTRVVSAPVLIIVALAGVCSVTVPRLRSAIFCIKMLTVILSGFFGFLGLFASVTAVLLYVLNLTSFGADYTESLVRPRKSSFKDTFYRTGWSKMIMRPIFNKKDKVRQKDEK